MIIMPKIKWEPRYKKFNDKELDGLMCDLKVKSEILRDIRMITNEILSNTAYHDKNIIEQYNKFDKLKVPQEEKDIISAAWDLKNRLAKKSLSDLKKLCKKIKENGYV